MNWRGSGSRRTPTCLTCETGLGNTETRFKRERLRSLQFDPRLSNTQHYSFAPDILIREKETVACRPCAERKESAERKKLCAARLDGRARSERYSRTGAARSCSNSISR